MNDTTNPDPECEGGPVIVKLNRAAPPADRAALLAVVLGSWAVALGAMLWLIDLPISPWAAVLLWVLVAVISVYVVTVEATLIVSREAGAYVERRGPIGNKRRRNVLCAPGSARSVRLRERVDLDGDIRPYSAIEVVAVTASGEVVLCALGDRVRAAAFAKKLGAALGCEARQGECEPESGAA